MPTPDLPGRAELWTLTPLPPASGIRLVTGDLAKLPLGETCAEEAVSSLSPRPTGLLKE